MSIIKTLRSRALTPFTLFLLCLMSAPTGTSPVFAAARQPVITTSANAPEFTLSPADRDYLMDVYKDTWRYISTFVEPSTGLPYDSDARQPATSISNVGLYLAATVIAYKTNLITKEEALARINPVLDSLAKMEKWEGFPRVWLAARSLKPISGINQFSYSKHVTNLVGGLQLALSVFPDEMRQPIGGLLRGMRFKNLYDPKSGWLKGGYDAAAKNFAVSQPWGNWYNKFFASEARLISFYMIARGFAPEKHWDAMIRPIQQKDGVWFFVPGYEDGGAYMPYLAGLFIDERETMMGFSQQNYTQSQMTHAANIGAPVWGWSASLDTRGNYVGYGLLRDEIVAPYASILAIEHFPNQVIANLKTLEKMGARPSIPEAPPAEPAVSQTASDSVAAGYDTMKSVSPWALIDSTNVYFLDRDGKIQKFSDWVVPAQKEISVPSFDETAFLKLAEAIGYSLAPGETIKKITSGITAGTQIKQGLAETLSKPSLAGDLFALASRLELYSAGKIYFTNGRTAPVILSHSGEGAPKPWALIWNREVYFLDKEGNVQKFSSFIDRAKENEKISQYEKSPLETLITASTPELNGSSPTDSIASLTRGTVLKEELIQSLSPFSDLGDLTALASQTGLYVPGKVEYTPSFKSGVTVPAAFVAESKTDTAAPAAISAVSGSSPVSAPVLPAGDNIKAVKPWAVLDALEVFFLNREGKLSKLSDYVDAAALPDTSVKYDTSAFEKLAPVLGYSPSGGNSFQSLINSIRPGSVLKSGLTESLPEPSLAGELLGLGAESLVYTPCRLLLKDGKSFSCLLEPVPGGASKLWAVSSGTEVFFLNQHGEIEKLSSFLESGHGAAVANYDQPALSSLIQAMGFAVTDSSALKDWVKTLSYGTSVKPDLAVKLANPARLGELLGLGAKAGIYVPGQIQFTGGLTSSISYLSDGKALWFPGTAADSNLQTVVPIPGEASSTKGEAADTANQESEVKMTEETAPAPKPLTYGFIDSIDWKTGKTSPHYLMPSQGMSFLALANFLFDGVVRETFTQDPKMKAAAEKLLQDGSAEAKQISEQAAGQCLLDIPSHAAQPKAA